MKALFPLLVFHLALAAHAGAQDDSARLREALRNVTLQLRAAQAETADAQAAAIAAEQKTAALETKVATLEKRNAELARQADDDKAASEKTIAGLNNRLAEREKRLADYIAALDKWKAGYETAAQAARRNDAEREKLADEIVVLRRTLTDRERKNLALFNTAQEILDRYENHALGKAIAAREPFIGNARVRIENLVQGYRNKILDNRLSAPRAND